MSIRFVLYTLFSLLVIGAAYFVTFTLLLPRLELIDEYDTGAASVNKNIRRNGLSVSQARRMFDPGYDRTQAVGGTPGTVDVTAKSDSYADTSLDGVLVPLACSQVRRPCLTDRDCATLCRGNVVYSCDSSSNVCSEPRVIGVDGTIDENENEPPTPIKCRTDKGEYAVLQGFTDLGTANWNCVQLFPGWNDGPGTKFCENGVVDIDTRLRTPSYRDCQCPAGTTRIVYAISRLGQQVYGLPHCVKDPKFYNVGVDFLEL